MALVVACLSAGAAAHADDGTAVFTVWRPSDADGGERPQIRIGRALDLVGRPLDLAAAARMRGKEAQAPASAAMGFVSLPSSLPVSAVRLSSGFGLRTHPVYGSRRLHSGVDLAAPTGSPVIATTEGAVSMAGWNGGYGLYVAVEHGGGLQTRYGHMSRLNVMAGDKVRKGDVIGFVGSTGRSTGPHLHYEVRVNGEAIDPLRGSRGT